MNNTEIQENAKEIALSLQDYNILFSALRDAQIAAVQKYQDEDTNKLYEELVEKFCKLTRTMNWLVYHDDVVISMKKTSK